MRKHGYPPRLTKDEISRARFSGMDLPRRDPQPVSPCAPAPSGTVHMSQLCWTAEDVAGLSLQAVVEMHAAVLGKSGFEHIEALLVSRLESEQLQTEPL